MDNFVTQWNREEFLAYLLIHCMEADFVEKESEQQYITNKVGQDTFDKMYQEIGEDNDFQRANKIQNSFARLGFTNEDRETFIGEIQNVFDIDGQRDTLENNALIGLKRLLEI